MGLSLNSYTRMILLIFTQMHPTLHYVGWLVSHFPLFVCPSVSNTIKFWTIQSVLRKRKIVAKALDGQRYPLPLYECMWLCEGERGSGPEGAVDLCLVSFEALGLNFSVNEGIFEP